MKSDIIVNKKRFILFLFLTFCVSSEVLADSPTEIYTPQGSIVPDTYICDEISASDIAYYNWWVGYYYPNATRLADASATYNCHGYAWYVSEGGSHVWIGHNSATAEDVYWQDNSYLEESSETSGLKVSYLPDYQANHSAITTGSSGTFVSKWGAAPLMQHAYNYCPYWSGSTTYLKYYKRNNVYGVPADFSIIASALSAAPSGWRVVVASGSYSISGNLTIPSGVTLQLNSGASLTLSSGITFTVNGTLITNSSLTIPLGTTMNVGAGATVKFASGASLVTNGQLHVNGTSAQHVTLTSISGSSPGSWGSISISGLPASGSNISYADVSYGTKIQVLNATGVTVQHCNISKNNYGVWFSGSSSTYGSVLNNRITDCGQGVAVDNGANVTINDNTIYKTVLPPSGVGIYFYAGSGKVARNDVDYCTYGMMSCSQSSMYANSPYYYMRNNRITNCIYGLLASEYGTAMFGTTPPSDYMWNSIRNNVYNCVSGSVGTGLPATIMAQGDYWGGPPTSSMFRVFPPAYLSYAPYLDNDPWSGIPLPSAAPSPLAPPARIASNRPAPQSGAATDDNPSAYDPAMSLDSLIPGIDLLAKHDHKAAKDFFLSAISSNPANQPAYGFLYSCADSETTPEITRFFKSLPPQAAKEQKLFLAFLYLKIGDVKSARALNDEIISKNPGSRLAARAKLNNFFISLHNENDPVAASSALKGIISSRAMYNSAELSLAETALRTWIDPRTGEMPNASASSDGNYQSPSATDQTVADGMLSNYPNPFNPTTNIRYALSQPGHVTVKVYDIIGREVATLVNSEQRAGYHEVSFDASRLASGVYFYRISSGTLSAMKKMILVK